MANENQLTATAFFSSILFYLVKIFNNQIFDGHIIEISTYLLIILTSLYILSYMYGLKLFYTPLLGTIAFASTYLGVLLAGTRGLSNSSPIVVDGLSQIVIALFAIWHLSAMMRNLKLEINPFREERSKLGKLFYGIFYPPREFFRLLKVIIIVAFSFYLVISGLDKLGTANVNLAFLAKTERVSLNILFLGIQTPMMMASRQSVSRTFSEYLKNLEWAESAFYDGTQSMSEAYRQVLNCEEISYDSINSNGKHLWITVLLIIFLQAFENQLLALDLFRYNYGGMLQSILDVVLTFLDSII